MTERPVAAGRGRCVEHDLALGPTGECVLCRNNRRSSLPAPDDSPAPRTLPVGGVLLGLAASALLGVAIVLLLPTTEKTPAVSAETPNATPESAASDAEAPAAVRTSPGASRPRRSESFDSPSPGANPSPSGAPSGPENGPARGASSNSRSPTEVSSDRAEPSHAALGDEEMRSCLRQIDVELYTTSWCKYCEKARAFLQTNGVRFREYDVETDSAAAERKRSLVPGSGVPVARIDGQVMSGFSAARYAEAIRSSIERRSGASVQLRGL